MTPAERSRAAWARDRALAEAAAQRAARTACLEERAEEARAEPLEEAKESAAPVPLRWRWSLKVF